jgi:hypothetical protein
VRVGHPSAPDAQGGSGWRAYRSAERLYDVWGPVSGSAWTPYHCVPLFAALDRVPDDFVGPPPPIERQDPATITRAAALPSHARPGAAAPEWATCDTWILLDVPGRHAVEVAAWLVTAAGCQPVCTFDNWPHPKGLLRAEEILGELLRWATTVAEARSQLTPESPAVWICDSERLGERKGRPGEFDNRYYLDDSILPGPGVLRSARLRRVVYVTAGVENIPTVDLEGYLGDLLAANVEVLHVNLLEPALVSRPMAAPREPRPAPRRGFRRSAAGGFGSEVPEPSSGGG